MAPSGSALGRRQALAAVAVSMALGLTLNALHLAQDARQEAERMARTAEGILALVEAPAARAAYTYDQALSETVVRSLIALGSVTRASISDNLGRTLAEGEATPAEAGLRAATDALFGPRLSYGRTLTPPPLPPDLAAQAVEAPIGALEITLDTWALAEDFVDRSVWLIGLGFAKTMALAAALATVFHAMVTRPLARLARDVARLPPDETRTEVVSVAPAHARDELGRLAAAINGLLVRFRRAAEERRRIGEELARAERLTALGTLAGGVAHDFNNLLATVSASAELALAHKPEQGPARAPLDRVLAAARRGRQLVEQVMAFSRSERVEARALDLGAAVAEALALCAPAVEPRCEVRWEPPPETVNVVAAEAQIHQIVSNLCLNAAQACADRGVIRVTLASEGRHARLTVADDGPGMPEAVRRRAFEPFFTTKPVGEGSGLGLAVVYGATASLGGRVDLVSRPGAGTAVTIRLPLAVGAAAA